ncbi:tetratricopeptide repeat protein [Streptomyces sp. NBC_01320]|uniref:tetratricopeptide repeat protein n=3 Tax=unclassified Streptomyces TaxID=2593676 RepID=UPI002E0E2754|nr:sel1 repeat family protein [Streptomyces sp. NBC_01320]
MTPAMPAPRSAQIEDFLVAGQEAAEEERWVAAGLAWIEAAKLGSLEGANATSRVATPRIKPLANAGDPDAQALMAGILMDYYTEDALPIAVGYAKASAAAGHAAGLRTFGFMLLRGLGVEENRLRALELFRAAAGKGDGYGAFNAAVIQLEAADSSDRGECIRLLTQAADSGIVGAAAKLGDELAVDGRQEEALGWYLWAAERGHDGAADVAADWYRDGVGTAPDLVQAMRWLLGLTAKLNVDAVHQAHELGKRMTDESILEAGRLAGQPAEAELMIATLAKNPERE